MKTNQRGIDLVKLNEGLRLRIYLDTAGKKTIGYGHLLTADDLATQRFVGGITKEQAEEIFVKDLAIAEAAVQRLVHVPLNENEFSALVDFVFNLGEHKVKDATLFKKLNAGDHAAVPHEMSRWNKEHDEKTHQLVVNASLAQRRARSAALWNLA